ncbi:aldo/keto reductase [Streptomyces sp. NRRL B-1347]|uniref:aldo/keto reductase n=1 Tax=Streptomyces sp. NRRL B-1347 TaxID=1476877 RepID=UPI0004CB48E7|nr:aldo/keto reductase [Streptomyces sp. NRRL B-1347]
MLHRALGTTGPQVSALGLGCMGMSALYGPADRDESLATVHAALEAGITLLDTGDFYGMGHNELLIRDALRAHRREEVQLSVKFGALRRPDGTFLGYDGRPAAVHTFLAYSLQRLGTDHIDIYRIARTDPRVPIEDTVGAIGEAVQAGYVRHIGLSEAGCDTLRRAAAVAPIADLQIEYSLLGRGIEAHILPLCRELGIAVTAYGVLARGLISDNWPRNRAFTPDDVRGHTPRYTGANAEHNLRLVDTVRALAKDRGTTVAQTAIAWALAKGSDIVPLVGARTRERLAEALGALQVPFSREECLRIEAAIPPGAARGDRYPADQMPYLAPDTA